MTQIAAALDLPVEALTGRPASQAPSCPSEEDCASLLAAFCRIEDHTIRAQCLAFVEGFARRDPSQR